MHDLIRNDAIAIVYANTQNMSMVAKNTSKYHTMAGEDTIAGFATPVEAATFLRLSKAMIHKLIGEGKVPACRYGRAVRIPWSWLKGQALGAKQ